jgi:apolipoprotein N-acyltransferase
MKLSKQLSSASVLLLPLTGGILMGLTPAPVEAWFLAWIALVPLWFLVANGKGVRQCALYGLVWGIGYHGLALFWITGIHPMTWMGVPWLASVAIALFCWTFITLWGAILVALWAACLFWIFDFRFWSNRKPRILPLVRVLAGTALWCGLESLWSAGSLWWTSLSYTQSPHNLLILHLGQLSGPSTVTAAIVAVNALIAEAWISYQYGKELKVSRLKVEGSNQLKVSSLQVEGSNQLKVGRLQVERSNQSSNLQPSNLQPSTLTGIAIGLFVVLHLIGFGLYSRPLIQPPETALKVGIIQGNIGNDTKLFTEGIRRALEGYTNGYEKLANQGVDAVLTPEGAFPFFLTNLKNQYFYSAILEKGVVAWVGAYGERGHNYTNSLFSITGSGETFSRYDKVKLVPLGEYIPFEPILGKIVDRLSPLDAHQVAGQPNQLFDTPFGRAVVGICYESAFSKHFRRQAALGGQFILTASNNAHYSPSMPAQHHAQDVMRAIETDRWAVRATNTGYSGIVNPHGRTLWISGINTYEVHADTIYRRQTQTLYVRWGDWLTPVLLGCAGVSWFVFNRR